MKKAWSNTFVSTRHSPASVGLKLKFIESQGGDPIGSSHLQPLMRIGNILAKH